MQTVTWWSRFGGRSRVKVLMSGTSMSWMTSDASSSRLGSATHVRALGETLIAAADEIEQMNGYDQIGVIRSRLLGAFVEGTSGA